MMKQRPQQCEHDELDQRTECPITGRGLQHVVEHQRQVGQIARFAVAVVQRVATPGIEINKLFRLVRDDVMEATAGRQEPYTYGSLPGKEDFFFVAR